jgi:hypothetical protein
VKASISKNAVMPGLVPGIHGLHFLAAEESSWMAGPSPAMTDFVSAICG